MTGLSIRSDENLRELVRLTSEEIKSLTADETERLKILGYQIKDLDSRLERLYDALETGKVSLDDLAPQINSLVAHTGFGPVISSLRGRCPRPLDECATP